jgi:hypothetical protein
MSIVDLANVAAQAKHRELKTLIVDIERLPGSFTADFWDMNAFKNRRIHPDQVTAWPTTICFAALWYERPGRPTFHAAWEDGGADAMYEAAFKLYDEADLVMTYNGIGFDNKHLVSGWTERGMGRPSPWRDLDLLRVARQSQGWESKTLDSVCKRLNVPTKVDHYSVQVARDAMAGDVQAQRKLKRYNIGDVQILRPVYEALLPYVKNHPHVAPSLGLTKPTCPRCGSTDVTRKGNYSPGVYNYVAYKCDTCSGPFRTTYESRGPSVRAL